MANLWIFRHEWQFDVLVDTLPDPLVSDVRQDERVGLVGEAEHFGHVTGRQRVVARDHDHAVRGRHYLSDDRQ